MKKIPLPVLLILAVLAIVTNAPAEDKKGQALTPLSVSEALEIARLQSDLFATQAQLGAKLDEIHAKQKELEKQERELREGMDKTLRDKNDFYMSKQQQLRGLHGAPAGCVLDRQQAWILIAGDGKNAPCVATPGKEDKQ